MQKAVQHKKNSGILDHFLIEFGWWMTKYLAVSHGTQTVHLEPNISFRGLTLIQ